VNILDSSKNDAVLTLTVGRIRGKDNNVLQIENLAHIVQHRLPAKCFYFGKGGSRQATNTNDYRP
jgi:hypothetical protein